MAVMFDKDTMVYPKESEWFQGLNNATEVVPLEDSDWYKSDAIGLKTLNEAKKVQFVKIEGDHLQFTAEDITNTFIPFLIQ
jgi:palmitoyl-protein thioesterase